MPGRRGLDDLIERSEPPGVEFLLDFVSGGQLTDGVGADVAHLDLPGPQVPQGPLGDRATLGRRQGLRRRQAGAHPGQPGPGEHVRHPAVGHPPGPGRSAGRGLGSRPASPEVR